MKQFFLLIFIFGFASKSFGQSEFNNKFKAIPPINTKEKPKKETLPALPPLDIPKIVTPNVFNNTNILNTKPKVDNSFQVGGPDNHFSMTPTNKFVNPGDKVVVRLNKIHLNEGTAYREDQDLGGIKTKSTILKIVYRDFGEVDGDEIQVLLNDVPIIGKISLGGEFRSFDIVLIKGANDLGFFALNEGFNSPNTAEFQIFDEQGILIMANQWSLFSGYKATVIITKEK
jgi:hypothetical protein